MHQADDPTSDIEDFFYRLDNIHLTSVGIDVGSSTSHLMFSSVHLRRETLDLSSRYVLVSREVLWRSAVRLTPYLDNGLIDATAISQFVAKCHADAGISPDDVDTGAVILTGEALKRRNARALADAVAAASGDFVCVTAGHNLEALLAAHGSGSVDLSARHDWSLLCVDIGGGTTKLSLIRGGHVIATAAIEVGGRIVAWDDQRRLVRVTPTANTLIGRELRLGEHFSEDDERVLATAAVNQILAVPTGRPSDLDETLVLTESVFHLMTDLDAVTFSGGVSEYIFEREHADYGDLGRAIGAGLRAAIAANRIPGRVVDPGQGIRATVVGTSQCSMQVSGSTVAVSNATLSIRNIPVVHPIVDLDGNFEASDVTQAIIRAVDTHDIPNDATFALSLSWGGAPSYPRLFTLARGIDEAMRTRAAHTPLVVMLDKDLGASLGAILTEEVGLRDALICLDNLELRPLDYVDIGPPIQPAGVFPVVIKSLLFGAVDTGRESSR